MKKIHKNSHTQTHRCKHAIHYKVTSTPNFAINHVSTPRLSTRQFLDLAAKLNCTGVELRNDLVDKGLTDQPWFNGEEPAAIGDHARDLGLRLLGLSEAYGFNDWSENMHRKVATLIVQAQHSGAESISLIPNNAGDHGSDAERADKLESAMCAILPMLEEANMVALIEPLGFISSSLRRKSEAVAAIEAVGGSGRFKLVHDTFHHHIAADADYFPEHTGIVHISGVVDGQLSRDDMRDEHRILLDSQDHLGNVEQIHQLMQLGYTGCFSFECFATAVHDLEDPASELASSMTFIREAMAEKHVN